MLSFVYSSHVWALFSSLGTLCLLTEQFLFPLRLIDLLLQISLSQLDLREHLGELTQTLNDMTIVLCGILCLCLTNLSQIIRPVVLPLYRGGLGVH